MISKLVTQQFQEARQAFLEQINISEEEVLIQRNSNDAYFYFDSPDTYEKKKVWLPTHLCTSKNYLKYLNGSKIK